MTTPTHLSPRILRATAGVLLALCLAPVLVQAQFVGPGTGGTAALDQSRRYLTDGRRVLVIGAHPDDEDTELITILSRGRGIETAYLSLTRGEGGQNLIGGELGAALGVVRTEELLAARRIDGAHQYFTRAYDFGFSKTATEAFQFWPRDSLVKDVVRIIRRFKPDVIVSVWTGTPLDGHGHHQASGIVAREAFDAAQDPTRFPDLGREEGLAPWRPLKFYRDYRAEGPGQSFDGGALDRPVGQSYHQIAARSRSQHRSQDMGQLQDPGPSSRRIVLEAVSNGLDLAADTSLFAGIAARPYAGQDRRGEVALGDAGLVLDAYADDDEVVPGQIVTVTMLAWNTGKDTVRSTFGWEAITGFEVTGTGTCPGRQVAVAPGAVYRCTSTLRVQRQARIGQPYFLVQPVERGQYRFTGDPRDWGEPFNVPLTASFAVRGAGGLVASVTREVTARSLDQGSGELRRPVTIVPRILMRVVPGELLWRTSLPSRTIRVQVEHLARDSSDVVVRLTVPDGWVAPPAVPLRFDREDEHQEVEFKVTRPASVTSGEVSFLAEAIHGGDTLRVGGRRIDYPHIQPHLLFRVAEATATIAPVRFAGDRRIGYVRGAADAIPEALSAAGVPFRLLAPAELEGPALDSLDVLVIGPRAYEVDPAVGRANPRLLAFARGGGTLLVQYQQYQYVAGGFAPYPITIGRPHDRITDEHSPVRWLPGSEALAAGPNPMTATDWEGWVQERGLYFAATWDSAWTPMLEMTDPGEAPIRGGVLVATYGRGRVVYAGLAFFRQLPAAVPGAWRLFANLLAIGAP
ncbi:MAG TPA: PIG-L family deacetylase [Gemmatimonadales bacterium]|nr:PIG-L family deacetylase [Gemmatimonadales bacterium]